MCFEEKNVLFDVVIIEKPSSKAKDEEMLEKIIFGPKTIVAKDKEHAKTLALLSPEFHIGDAIKSRVEVLVRPFA